MAIASLGAVETPANVKLPELKLADGRTLKQVEFVSYSTTAVMARWEGGRGQLKYELLPNDVRLAALKRKPAGATASSFTSTNTPKAGSSPLIKLSYDDTSITISNEGSEDWNEAVVYINGDPPFTFKATMAAPKVGKSLRINLGQFIKKDGERFNPSTHALTVIWVGGNGFDFEKYRAN